MSEFNWTIISIGSLVVVFPVFFIFLFTLKKYRRSGLTHLFYLSMVWFFAMIMLIGAFFANILLSETIFLIRNLLLIGIGYSVIFLLDTISRESLDLTKGIIFTVLASFLIAYGFLEESTVVVINTAGESVFKTTGTFSLLYGIYAIAIGACWTYFVVRIFFSAPQSLKKQAGWLLLGGLLIGIFPGIIYVFNLNSQIPGIDNVFTAFGLIITAVILMRENKLAFILPFKAIKLMVFDTRSGTPVFSHSWVKQMENSNDIIFSGMLHAIGILMTESLNRGQVQAVLLEKGYLLLHQFPDKPFAVVLLASRQSRTLERSYKKFLRIFLDRFQNELGQSSIDLNSLLSAEYLVNDVFPFIPEY